ncbi:hypothetical protein R3W88_021074 [Solanum pinnatisectum]|uniref:Neprosin PEP catalytic domain-containing protein n=1 Tax=Solanum pinnatisectum TaxID=50273 RepID=A0AAV9LQT5_9SOLN|nr:hypothetical protein R3W88_021074 [Solanum pinnatisectum]
MLRHQNIYGRLLLSLFFLLSYNGVQGETKLSKREDTEMEKQLKLLNKPAVKTIKTIYGDTYDCVDFYKQPAFNHPLLKNHNFHPQMKPILVKTKQNAGNSSTSSSSSRIWRNGKGCPYGTVPIRRITKDDLIRQKNIPPPEDVTFDTQLTNNNSVSEPTGMYGSSGYKVAIARTKNYPDNKFSGAGMAASIWNPPVKDGQHSACRLKIQKGSDILQVGWRVDPTLYGDNKTRLFIHFQAGNNHCFNTLCPGFIIVNTEVPLDKTFQRNSQRGETSWEDTMAIARDQANGNWWLFMEENHIQIGFWPQRIFTELTSFATNVEWGGVVYSPPGVPKPPMGSSFFSFTNDKGETIDPTETTTFVNNPDMYFVFDVHNFKHHHFVLYGGPGDQTQV